MHRNYPPLLAILTTAVVSIAGAATPTIKRAPTNISTVQLQQRLTPMLTAMRQQQAAEVQQTMDSAHVAFKALAPERAALTKALNADPRFKTYIAQAEHISRSGATPRERVNQLALLAKSNRVIFDDALRSARIERSTLQAKLGAVTLAADMSVRTSRKAANKVNSLSTPAVALGPTDLEFTQPFDLEDTASNNQGLAYQAADGTANSDTGKTRAESVIVGLAGGAYSTAEVGQTFTVPDGVARMEVTVSVVASYDLKAASALGISGACGSFFVDVTSLDDRRFGHDGEHQCAYAPLAWYVEDDRATTTDYVFSASVPQNDRTYTVTARSYSSALGGGVPGYGDALGKAELKKIRVKFFR